MMPHVVSLLRLGQKSLQDRHQQGTKLDRNLWSVTPYMVLARRWGMKRCDKCQKLRKILDRIWSKKASCPAREIGKLLRAFGFTVRISSKNHDVWSGHGRTITIPRPKQKHLKVPYVVQIVRLCEDMYFQCCERKIQET